MGFNSDAEQDDVGLPTVKKPVNVGIDQQQSDGIPLEVWQLVGQLMGQHHETHGLDFGGLAKLLQLPATRHLGMGGEDITGAKPGPYDSGGMDWLAAHGGQREVTPATKDSPAVMAQNHSWDDAYPKVDPNRNFDGTIGNVIGGPELATENLRGTGRPWRPSPLGGSEMMLNNNAKNPWADSNFAHAGAASVTSGENIFHHMAKMLSNKKHKTP